MTRRSWGRIIGFGSIVALIGGVVLYHVVRGRVEARRAAWLATEGLRGSSNAPVRTIR